MFRYVPLVLLVSVCTPALAQRTADNAVTASEDAFGKSVGDERIGIYSSEDVRGFSPTEAGNIRLEGLYFALQGRLSDRIVAGSSIKVGLTAQGYPFPAPTGISDLTLRRPGKDLSASSALLVDSEGGYNVDFDARIPLDGERLGLNFGAIYGVEAKHFGSTNLRRGVVAGVRYAPSDRFSLASFVTFGRPKGEEAEPQIFLAAGETAPPPPISQTRNLVQPWTQSQRQGMNVGFVSKAQIAGFAVALGAFHSEFNTQLRWSDLLLGVRTNGMVANHRFIRQQGDNLSANSGEFKIARSFPEGPRLHTVYATLRGKWQQRDYGGNFVYDTGRTSIGLLDLQPAPNPIQGAKVHDDVRQISAGIGYGLRWPHVGELNLGLLKTSYRKTSVDPVLLNQLPGTRSNPLLPSATLALTLSKRLAVYGGYVKGLEDSAVAPSNATNLNEAPPAILTEQKDAGIRWKFVNRLTLIAGVFAIQKPYFNLDQFSRFRQLGTVQNRGIEISLAGQIAPGLNVVAGSVIIDAKVSNQGIVTGNRPVGEPTYRSILSLNYAVPRVEGLSIEGGIEAIGKRRADSSNLVVVRGRALLNLGARYRFKLSGAAMLARLQLTNLANRFDYNVASSGALTTLAPRKLAFTIAADF